VTQQQAWELYDLILSHERVGFSLEPPGLEAIWRKLTRSTQYSPSVWNDAYIAAFALACDFEVVTFDRGFAQFQDLRCTVLT